MHNYIDDFFHYFCAGSWSGIEDIHVIDISGNKYDAKNLNFKKSQKLQKTFNCLDTYIQRLQKLQEKLQPIQFMSSTGYIKNRPHSEWVAGFDGVEFDTNFNGGKIYHLQNQIQLLTELEDYLSIIFT